MNLINTLQCFFVVIIFTLLLSHETFGEQLTDVKIAPTDDVHILADLNDPTDTSELMKKNTGSLDSIQLFSSWNVTESNNAFVAIGYLKFDLSQQNTHNLEKAEIKLLAREVSLSETPKNVVLLHVPNNNWKESDITYLKRPSYSTTIAASSEISTPNTWYSWDVTNLVKQNPAAELSVALTFETAKVNTQDYVSFYSKEFSNKDYVPYLALSYSPNTAPLLDTEFEQESPSNFFVTIIISGIVGAVVSGIVTKTIISKNKSGFTPKPKQSIQIEKTQCKNCGKILPKQFKYCPFCSTQLNQ